MKHFIWSRAGRYFTAARTAAAILAVLLLSGCTNPFFAYREFNPNTSETVDFFDSGLRRASFGESARRANENFASFDRTAGTARIASTRLPASGEFNAGKIANSLDGISYLFRQVPAERNFKLSATIEVVSFGGTGVGGETTSNGQEGFGLMARDFIPFYNYPEDAALYPDRHGMNYSMDYLESVVEGDYSGNEYFISSSAHSGRSNMVFAGGVKRGVRYGYRRGVIGEADVITNPAVQSDGAASNFVYKPDELASYSDYPTLEERPDFPLVGAKYRFSMEKTNSGFKVSMTPPAEKGEEWEDFIWEPDLLTAIDKDHYYIGFFAARACEILVSDVDYSESDAEQDAPLVKPQPIGISPEFEIISPSTNSHPQGRFYRIIAMANVPGFVSVKQNGEILSEWVEGQWRSDDPNYGNVARPAYFDIPTRSLVEGENVFQILFYPKEEYPIPGFEMKNTEPVKRTFLVERRTYFTAGTPIYAAPDGRSTNTGSSASPLDIKTGISFVQPGQTLILKNGTYTLEELRIPRFNSGRDGSPKRIEAETRDQVFIDFNKNVYAKGAVIEGSYWEISGIHVRNTPNKVKGLEIMGDNNRIEWVKTYNNGDTGMQISGRSTLPQFMWPKNNTVIYSESFNNRDAAEIDADGFGAKLTVGEGNRFDWCISHNNADDGWDLYSKVETGNIGVVVIENSIAYRNGILMDGRTSAGGRNGFKLGGEGMAIPHVVRNSIAFQNGTNGFTSNSNPAIILEHVTAFDNGGSGHRNFTIYNSDGIFQNLSAELSRILSLYSTTGASGKNNDRVELKNPLSGYAWVDGASKNANNNLFSNDSVESLTAPLWNSTYTQQLSSGEGFIKRAPDGSFELDGFLVRKDGAPAAGATF